MHDFAQACLDVLQQQDPANKAALALCIAPPPAKYTPAPPLCPPDTPARPNNIATVAPGRAPRRKWGTTQGRLIVLHAIAHIELNAIDLAFDMIVRFGFCPPIAPKHTHAFCLDWLRVGQEEARHFGLVCDLLAKRGVKYGDFPIHQGMWDAAHATADRVDARLAIAPLVLEARGLDVTPPMIEKLEQARDTEATEVLRTIYGEEIGHVAIGVKWFAHVCRDLQKDPQTHFKQMVAERFTADLKPPFNKAARTKAGLPENFYL